MAERALLQSAKSDWPALSGVVSLSRNRFAAKVWQRLPRKSFALHKTGGNYISVISFVGEARDASKQ